MHLVRPEDFEPWVGRKVRVNTMPAPVEITLERVERRPALARGLDHREPFSLFFTAPLGVFLLDMAYQFDCGRGGPHTMLIAQLHPSTTTRRYEAAFA